jgi:hypothetical protein
MAQAAASLFREEMNARPLHFEVRNQAPRMTRNAYVSIPRRASRPDASNQVMRRNLPTAALIYEVGDGHYRSEAGHADHGCHNPIPNQGRL